MYDDLIKFNQYFLQSLLCACSALESFHNVISQINIILVIENMFNLLLLTDFKVMTTIHKYILQPDKSIICPTNCAVSLLPLKTLMLGMQDNLEFKGLSTVDISFKNFIADNTLDVLLKIKRKYFRVAHYFSYSPKSNNNIKVFILGSAQCVIQLSLLKSFYVNYGAETFIY